MKKYLVPIDGSKNSERALRVCIDLAKKTGAEIKIFSVIDFDSLSFTSHYNLASCALMDKNKEFLEKLHSRYLEKYKSEKYSISSSIVVGNIAHEIMEESKDGYDLIIMGCRGLSKLERTFLGSVSSKIVNNASVSTLIVKEYDNEIFNKILVPIDGSKNSIRALKVASNLGLSFNSKLTLLSIEESSQLFEIGEIDLKDCPVDTNDETYKKIQAIVDKELKSYDGEIKVMFKKGTVSETIASAAEDGDYGLIVMGSRGLGAFSRAIMGSVALNLMHLTDRAVLVIR